VHVCNNEEDPIIQKGLIYACILNYELLIRSKNNGEDPTGGRLIKTH